MVHTEQLVFLLWAVDITALKIKTVKPQQGRFFTAVLAIDQDNHPLVRMVLNVTVPQLVLDYEGHVARGDSYLSACLHHDEANSFSCIGFSSCGSVYRIRPDR